MKKVTYADGSGITYIYADPHDPNNLTRKENFAGHRIAEWEYDNAGRATLSRMTDDSGVSVNYLSTDRVEVTEFTDHAAAGQPGTIIDVNQVETDLAYDGRGRVVEAVNRANNGQRVYTYTNGLLEQSIDADGITRTFAYDPEFGRLASVTEFGAVVGINTFKKLTRKFEGLGFAIPIRKALQ